MIRAAIPILLSAILGPLPALAPFHAGTPDPPAPTIREMIAAAAEHHGLRTEFLYKRAWDESRLNPDADDGHGDYGLMQLAERWFPGASTMSAETNLDLGAAYLARQLAACRGNEACAHRAYRTGHP